MSILITICARGGSKGIPGKNIKLINGIPLIFYSLQTAVKFALKSEQDVKIVLSTDSTEIKDIVKSSGLDINVSYTRPDSLATDSAGKIDVIKDVLLYSEVFYHKEFEYLIDLDVTSPLRTTNDLIEALNILKTNTEAYNIFSVSPANRNPYFNMVEEDSNGYFSTSKTGTFLTRQSAPKVYDMNASFYIYRKAFFENNNTKTTTTKSLIFEVPHMCFDLDHQIDFLVVSFLIENELLDFDFQ